MSNYSGIPVKTKSEGAISAIEFEIDTEGLDCVMKSVGTDMWVYTKSGASGSERFFVKDGENFEFCGKLYYCVATSGTVYFYMYNRI